MHWEPPARMEGAVYAEVVWPERGKPMTFIGLCSFYAGLWTHWIEKSVWCSRELDCPLCAKFVPSVWKGYLPCIDRTTREFKILLFGRTIGEQINRYRMAGTYLRGRDLTFSRSIKKKNSPVEMYVGEVTTRLPLPEAFDPTPSALFTLGMNWTEIETLVKGWKRDGLYMWENRPKV